MALLRHRTATRSLLLLATAMFALRFRKADAFFPTNALTVQGFEGRSHEKITTDALEALDRGFFGGQSPNGSMRAANQEIADANKDVDDDQLHSSLHFDGENFAVGQGRLLALKAAVLAALGRNDGQGARQDLGQALHSIQDFYAHSNWTNNHAVINLDLGVEGRQIQNTLGPNDPAEVNGMLTTLLTSGYYDGEDRMPPPLQNGHKDRHGGPFDHLSLLDFGLGLNRDSRDLVLSPEFLHHDDAADLATDATKKYIHEITDQVSPQQVALLLGKGPTLGLVIDTTNSMGPIIAAVREAAVGLVNNRLGTPLEPSQYVLGQIDDPVTPPPVVTANVDDFKSAITALTTIPPGLDCPELAMEGMLLALGPADPRGHFFVFTDATAKDSARAGSVIALAQSKNIRIDLLLFGSCSPIDPGYIQIANATGGQVFFLTPAEVAQAAKLPGLLVGTNSVNLLSVRDSVESGSKTYDVPVDSTMTDVTFSVDTSSMQVQRPGGAPVQAADADATILQLTGGSVVKIDGPAVGHWKVTVGVSSTYRLTVSGSSTLDMSRFRFVRSAGRSGHEGAFPIPGLPVAGASATADAVMTGSFTGAHFDLRRPAGDHIQDVILAPVSDELPSELTGSLDLPNEPFLAYVTGQDAGGNAFQRMLPKLIQPQSVSIATPLRQDLHAGAQTIYRFTVTNTGDAGTFNFDATDDQGFITSADPAQAEIPAGGMAELTVILAPPADAAPGTSDALTVRAVSAGTPGLENFASLASVVAEIETTTTSSTASSSTSTSSTTSTTRPSGATTTTTTTSSSTSTTVLCTTPRCTIDAALRGACDGQTIPPSVRKKLDRSTALIDRAGSGPAKKARSLLKQAKHTLRAAGKAAGRAAKGKKPKLTKDCAAAIQRAASSVGDGLRP